MCNHRHSIRLKNYDYNNSAAGKGRTHMLPLHRVIQWFKTMITNEYIRSVKHSNWRRFTGKLWQRGYYEHIIRNDNERNNICEYIKNNSTNWINS